MVHYIRHTLFVTVSAFLFGCDSENSFDCTRTAGSTVQKEINVPSFDRILVNENLQLVIRQDTTYSVVVETGSNLVNDVTAEVLGGRLVLTNAVTCNWIRDYGDTRVFVTAPNITEIRSSTQWDVRSEGTLSYLSLAIISENFNMDSVASGNFYLTLHTETFNVLFNNLSNCFVSGNTVDLRVNFPGGNGRFEGAELSAERVSVFHRGSNDMIVNPLQRIEGEIFGPGHVRAVNRPEEVEVTEYLDGRLIFGD